MSQDLSRGLLNKKTAFDRLFEDCLVRIQRIKQKNDAIQKQVGTEVEDHIREEIQNQSEYLEKEINELRNVMNQMEQKYRDPESKNKIKQLKSDAQKQIERNKIILKDMIKDSFVRRSQGRGQQEDPETLMEGGKIDYDRLDREGGRNGGRVNNEKEQIKESLLTEQLDIDYELERKMMLQRNEMINQVEQSTSRINDIMNDMGIMVEQQGQNLDIISDELMKTNQNLMQTNQNLEEANSLQKKAKKKYITLVVIILIIIAAVAGIIFFVAI